MTARYATAASSQRTQDLREQILDAGRRRTPLRIVGAGTWLDANRPVHVSEQLSTRDLAGIVEYVPGDLTITVGAGTTLGDLATATADSGQWVGLDPFGTDAGTVGATFATGSAGPLAHHFGAPRDVVLGVEFITGTGKVVRGGGRVVKNVAGFDLARLITGSWGSLGVITELTLRLRARPEAEETRAVSISQAPDALRDLGRRLSRMSFLPYAAEVVSDALARRLALSDSPLLLVRLGGSAPALRAQREAIGSLGDSRDVPTALWETLRATEPPGALVVRLSHRPSEFADTWAAGRAIVSTSASAAAFCHGHIGRGVVRCVLPAAPAPAADDALLRALSQHTGVTRIFERLPPDLWARCAPSSASDRLSRGIKQAYDPLDLMNPGILGVRS